MDRSSITFQAGGETFEVFKPRLKDWIELDEIQEKFFNERSPQNILDYLAKSTKREVDFWANLPWIDVLNAYLKIATLNAVSIDLPMLMVRDGIRPKSLPWDYPGRGWYIWLHILAKAYGWFPEKIARMEVEDAFALLQEIETEKQLEREWEWQTTELAYPYDSQTKKSNYHPLPRPVWMRAKVGPPPKPRVLKKLMPVGNIIDLMHDVDAIASL